MQGWAGLAREDPCLLEEGLSPLTLQAGTSPAPRQDLSHSQARLLPAKVQKLLQKTSFNLPDLLEWEQPHDDLGMDREEVTCH